MTDKDRELLRQAEELVRVKRLLAAAALHRKLAQARNKYEALASQIKAGRHASA